MSDVLKQERETYKRELPDLLDREGQWVLIKGDKVVGVWATRDAALYEGYMRLGGSSFMVKQIGTVEPIRVFTREVFSTWRQSTETSPLTAQS